MVLTGGTAPSPAFLLGSCLVSSSRFLLLWAPWWGGDQRGPAVVEGTPLRGPSSESGRPDGQRSWAAHRGDGMPSAVLRALGSLAEPAWTLAPGAATGGHPTQEDGRGPPQGSHGPKASSLPPDGGQVESSRGQWREKPARYEIAPQPQQHRTRG